MTGYILGLLRELLHLVEQNSMCARTELVSPCKRKFYGICWPLKNSWTYKAADHPCGFFIQRTQYLRRVLGATNMSSLIFWNRVSMVIPPCQKSRYATYFDVAVLRCLLQPHWSEEGTQWSLMYYLQRLRHMLQEKPEKPPEPEITPLPRLRSSSMVAAAPSLVNTHKTQVSSYHPYETSGVVLGSGGQMASEKHSFGVGKTAQRSDMCIDSHQCEREREKAGKWWGVWRAVESWRMMRDLEVESDPESELVIAKSLKADLW